MSRLARRAQRGLISIELIEGATAHRVDGWWIITDREGHEFPVSDEALMAETGVLSTLELDRWKAELRRRIQAAEAPGARQNL